MSGFWTKTDDGHVVHVNGNRHMDDQTLAMLTEMMDRAVAQHTQGTTMDAAPMTSTELNARIRAICDQEPPIYDAFGGSGKPIPFIGWFWRDVDFDQPTYDFGVIPVGADGNHVPLIGFMENNKWGYPEIKATPEAWATITQLLAAAVIAPSPTTLAAANAAIQALVPQEAR